MIIMINITIPNAIIEINQDAVFLDLGSNLGVYSLLVAQLRHSTGDQRFCFHLDHHHVNYDGDWGIVFDDVVAGPDVWFPWMLLGIISHISGFNHICVFVYLYLQEISSHISAFNLAKPSWLWEFPELVSFQPPTPHMMFNNASYTTARWKIKQLEYVLFFSHSIGNNKMSRELVTLVHNAVR